MKKILVLFFIFLIVPISPLLASDKKIAKLDKLYQKSITDAETIEPEEIVPVKTLSGASGRFVTWTSYPDSYQPGEDLTLAWGETWVTIDGDVQNACKKFSKNTLDIRIQQLLGLPPKKEAKRFFAVLEVKTEDMFRPCASPSLEKTACSESFGSDVTEEHKAWYETQAAASYKPDGYPWTRLGYTYNWSPKNSEVGLSEFVVKKGSTVKVVSITPTETYCL